MSKFRPGKPMTFFVIFFFPILIFLGSWQVVRGLEKTDIVEQHYMNKSLPVINEKDMSQINAANLKYRTVIFMENLDKSLTFLITDFTGKRQGMKSLQHSRLLKIIFF